VLPVIVKSIEPDPSPQFSSITTSVIVKSTILIMSTVTTSSQPLSSSVIVHSYVPADNPDKSSVVAPLSQSNDMFVPPVIVRSIAPSPAPQASSVTETAVVNVAVFTIGTIRVSVHPLSSVVIISQSSAYKFDKIPTGGPSLNPFAVVA